MLMQRSPRRRSVLTVPDDAQSLWYELHGKPRAVQNRRAKNTTDRRELGVHGYHANEVCRLAGRRVGTRCRRAETERIGEFDQ